MVNWTRKIPTDLIDLAKKATSGADRYLMWGGLFFLAISKICFLGQFVMLYVEDMHGNKMHDLDDFMYIRPNYEHMTVAKIMLLLYKMTTFVCELSLLHIILHISFSPNFSRSVRFCPQLRSAKLPHFQLIT
jgi:magnesium-transporting ATPase (P-type)